jgi:gamma-glutamyltranspeptidase / glutathione hydrolase
MTRAGPETWTVQKPAVWGRNGLVVTQHIGASTVGAQMLAAGGTAVDATIAAAMALQIVEPWMSGLFGCGYLLVQKPGWAVAQVVEFTGLAPRAIDPARYAVAPEGGTDFLGKPRVQGDRNVTGLEAVVTPGAVAGLGVAHQRWGRLGWDRLLAPAIDLARQGQRVDWHTTLAIAIAAADLAKDAGARARFLPGGHPPPPGTMLPTGALADTLALLADEGPEGFYTGRLATRIFSDLAKTECVLSAQDFAAYRPRMHDAETGRHGDMLLHVAPTTSGGPRLLAALAGYSPTGDTPHDALRLATSLQRAFTAHRDRLQGLEPQGSSTTHLSVVDADGMVVSLTFTLLARFGAKVVLPTTGLLLNNGMAWFDPIEGRANSIAPGARGANNMCPLIGTTPEGHAALALGASGGNQIIPALAQVLTSVLDDGLSLEAALARPRFDIGLGSVVMADDALPEPVVAALATAFTVRHTQRTVYPRPFAAPAGLLRGADGVWEGAADVSYPAAGVVKAQ